MLQAMLSFILTIVIILLTSISLLALPAFILTLILFSKTRQLRQELEKLKQNFSQTTPPATSHPVEQTSQTQPEKQEPYITPPSRRVRLSSSQPQQIRSDLQEAPEKATVPHTEDIQPKSSFIQSNVFLNWLKVNWTGFLGVVILVLGITFSGLYVGLSASPVVRFFLLLATAAGIGGCGWLLTFKRKNWIELGGWLFSASAAIFLFACLGAGHFEGLCFITNYNVAILLTLLGLAVNLFFAWKARTHFQTGFHILLSLLGLAFIPAEYPTLIMGMAVAFFGIVMPYRFSSFQNTLSTLIAFFLFNYAWSIHTDIGIGKDLLPLISATFIALTTLFLSCLPRKNTLPYAFATHLTNWLLWIGQLFIYGQVFPHQNLILLTILAILAFCLAKTRTPSDRFYQTDLLVGQGLSILAILHADFFLENYLYTSSLLAIESLIFTAIMALERQRIPLIIGMIVTGCIMFFNVIGIIADTTYPNTSFTLLLIRPLSITLFLYLIRWYFQKSKSIDSENESLQKKFDSFLDIGLLVYTSICIWLTPHFTPWGFYLLALGLWAASTNNSLTRMPNHRLIFWGILIETLIVSWQQMHHGTAYEQFFFYCLPVLTLLVGIYPSRILYDLKEQRRLVDFEIYIFSLYIGASSYLIFHPLNHFLPGAVILALSLLTLQISQAISSKACEEKNHLSLMGNTLKNTGVGFLIFFLVIHLLQHLQSEAMITKWLTIRFAYEILAVFVALYWILSLRGKIPSTSSNLFTDRICPYLSSIPFDILMIFLIIINAVETPDVWRPAVYASMMFVLLQPQLRCHLPQRKILYTFGFYLAALILIAVTAPRWTSPLKNWQYQPHIPSLIALAIVIFSNFRLCSYSLHGNPWFLFRKDFEAQNILDAIQKNIISISFPLLFASSASFFYWRFSSAILTLLWVTQAFVMMAIGYHLRHKLIIHITLAFLGVCVFRLLFFDLSQSDLFTRSLTFGIVGLLMIGIHVLYKKISPRLN